MDKIILYTIGCQKCNVLEKKLNAKGIVYDTIDDAVEVEKKAVDCGITSAPILTVNGEDYDYITAVNWVKGK